MSKLYLTANSDSIKTLRTARGHHWVKCALQSWEGSIGIRLDEDGNVEITCANGSVSDPTGMLWYGSLSDLLKENHWLLLHTALDRPRGD